MKILNVENDEQFHHCSKEAYSIPKHAKCLVDLLKMEKAQQTSSFSKFPQNQEAKFPQNSRNFSKSMDINN